MPQAPRLDSSPARAVINANSYNPCMPDVPSDPPRDAEPPPPLLPPSRPPNALPWWLALVSLVALIFALQSFNAAPPEVLPDPARVSSPILKVYARYMLGVDRLMRTWGPSGTPGTNGQLLEALATIEQSAEHLIDRIRVVPIIGEFAGSAEALARLDEIDQELADDPSIDQGFRDDAALLRSIYTADAGTPPDIDPARADLFLKRHEWFARLALAHGIDASDPRRDALEVEGARTMAFLVGFLIMLILIFLASGVLFLLAAVLGGTNRIRPALLAPPAVERSHAPLRARNALLESFVLFLLGFIAMSIVGGAIAAASGIDPSMALVWLLPLVALWPLRRGMNWTQLRHAMGWTRGKGIAIEALCGVAAHLAGLPLVGLGLLLSLLIIAITGNDASHPIAGEIDLSHPLAIVGLFCMTTLWAPIVEETFFRGALYGHLRRVNTLARRPIPVILASLITGLVFAVIHPQGVGGVPVLAALGMNFCFMREWRGSLVAPMTAHALHNAFITIVLIVFLA